METANISGSIRINLTPEYARQINWGNPFRKREEVRDVPLLTKIESTHGISGVWYTDNKNSELFAIIKVDNPKEGNIIADTIRGYEGVKDVKVSLGFAGPPTPPPSSTKPNGNSTV
jgi:hypothetical protein